MEKEIKQGHYTNAIISKDISICQHCTLEQNRESIVEVANVIGIEFSVGSRRRSLKYSGTSGDLGLPFKISVDIQLEIIWL